MSKPITQVAKYFSAMFVFFALVSTLGCGSSTDLGGGADDSDEDEISLAEAAADLPRPQIVGVGGRDSSDTTADDGFEAPIPFPSNTSSAAAGGGNLIMRSFLWKPESERDGNVVVLVDPEDVTVEVFGNISETLNDTGPSNGRGTTARGGHSGCDFGDNVRVQFFRNGAPIGFVNGQTTVVIADGCERVEFDL